MTPDPLTGGSSGMDETRTHADSLLDRILDQMQRGGVVPDAEQLAAQYPGRAEEIRQLLQVVRFMHEAAERVDPAAVLDARVHVAGERPVLGDFRLVREIARGGMGVVYEAVQQSLNRRVALKVLLPGVRLSPQALKRFQREAQTAGGLHHTNIVPIYAVGEAEGVSYYAMQYIEGESLAEFLKLRRAAEIGADETYFRQIAAWGREVADALDYAHGRGVIHRDIKPANVMLDRHQHIWVADFGLARQDTGQTLTEAGDVLGTVRYMSPEQARGVQKLDERSDIYSLGVSLYELACLQPPFDGPDRESTLKQVLLDEPRRLRQLNPAVPKPLETIIHKAMEKEPARRYASAATLAEDLRRFLADEPLLARPPGAGEQFCRLIVRYKVTFSFLAVLFLVLTAFAVTATIQAVHIAQERNKAVLAGQRETEARQAAEQESRRATAEAEKTAREARKAKMAVAFLQEMLASANPDSAQERDVTVREILDQAAQRIGTELAGEPEIEAAVRHTIGAAYMSLGFLEQAGPHLQAALDLQERALGAEHPETAAGLNTLAILRYEQSRFAEAEQLHRRALAVRQKTLGEHVDVADSLANLAALLQQKGEWAEAERLGRDALALRRKLLGDENVAVSNSLNNLAALLEVRGRLTEAEPLYRQALAIRQKLLDREHPETVVSLSNLGMLLYNQGKLKEAEPLFREVLEIRRRRLDPDHPKIAATLLNLGMLLKDLGRPAEAETLCREALAIYRKRLGNDHKAVALCLINLGTLLQDEGKLAEAEQCQRESLAIYRRLFGDEHADVSAAMNNLGIVLKMQGKLDEAEPLYREALAIARRTQGDHPDTVQSLASLARFLEQRGKPEEVEPLYREAVEMGRRAFGENNPALAERLTDLAGFLYYRGAAAECEPLLRQALKIQQAHLPAEHTERLQTVLLLGLTLLKLGRGAEAEDLLRGSRDMRLWALPEMHWFIGYTQGALGACLAAQGQFEESEALLLKGYEIVRQSPQAEPQSRRDLLEWLARLYESWGKPEKAAEYRALLSEKK